MDTESLIYEWREILVASQFSDASRQARDFARRRSMHVRMGRGQSGSWIVEARVPLVQDVIDEVEMAQEDIFAMSAPEPAERDYDDVMRAWRDSPDGWLAETGENESSLHVMDLEPNDDEDLTDLEN